MPTPTERFTELFERTRTPLLAYAVRRVADPADAADVVAEAYLVAWRRIDEVPPGEEARLWLFGVTRRVLANWHRGERRRVALADRLRDELRVLPAASEPDPRLARLGRALASLSGDDRELLALIAWDGLTPAEAGEVLGVAAPTVRVRLHRARGRLTAALDALQREEADLKRPATSGHVMSEAAAAASGTKGAR